MAFPMTSTTNAAHVYLGGTPKLYRKGQMWTKKSNLTSFYSRIRRVLDDSFNRRSPWQLLPKYASLWCIAPPDPSETFPNQLRQIRVPSGLTNDLANHCF